MLKGTDAYAVVAMNAAPTTSMCQTGIERSASSQSSRVSKGNVAGMKQRGEITEDGITVEIKVDQLTYV